MTGWIVMLACTAVPAVLVLLGVVQIVIRHRGEGVYDAGIALLAPPRVRCLRADGYEASLTVGRIYRRSPREREDPPPVEMVRVVDETGEDYLYPAEMFRPTWRWR